MPLTLPPDDDLMRLALAEARAAEAAGEVPVGAILLSSTGELLARGNNHVLRSSDPTAHAEIVALRTGGLALGNYRLPGTTLVTTLEPLRHVRRRYPARPCRPPRLRRG